MNAVAISELVVGDSIDVLKQWPDGCVDAVVCDPPYGLSREPDAAELLRHWLAGDDSRYEHRGGGFMGKRWDSFVPGPELWREVFRVLKPGGHIVAFFGSRTYDLGVMAMRLAGFEIRDSLSWMYGSGFPKSLDVSKAIDKAAGAEREVVAMRQRPDGTTRDASKGGRPGAVALDVVGGLNTNGAMAPVTAPATPDAAKWQGWGTALKPAHEPIVLARKPLVGTVAANVLAHGVGGLNVDGCRVGDEIRVDTAQRKQGPYSDERTWSTSSTPARAEPKVYAGRWPANVILDEGAARLLDEQSGYSRSPAGTVTQGGSRSYDPGGGRSKRSGAFQGHGDSGGASRFFYTAKASKAERELGLEAAGIPVKSGGELTDREDDSDGLNSPRAGAGRGGGRRNNHPTVKPVAVMRWLCRLITPPGGLVLDPFAGSGTTGIAAKLEGFGFVGIDLSDEYVEIARARIAAADQLPGGTK